MAEATPGLPSHPLRSVAPSSAAPGREREAPPRFQGTLAFALTELRVQGHESLALATSMIVQSVFIVFVWILSPGLLPFALIGAVIFSVFQIGERVLNEAAYVRIDHNLGQLYHASPLTPESYFVGMASGVMTAYLPPVVFLIALAFVVHPFGVFPALVLAGALGFLFLFAASMGYIFSTLFKDSRAIWPYSSLFYNAFGVLPPVFYPLATWKAVIPPSIEPLALMLPPSASAALVTWAEGLTPLSAVEAALAFGSIALEALLLFAFAIFWARRAATER